MKKIQLGQTIYHARKACGLTQEQLGGKLGVSAGAVSKWETDSALPDIAVLAPLARALDISLDVLLSYESELTGEEYAAAVRAIDNAFIHKGAQAGKRILYELLRTYPNNGGLQILGAKNIRMTASEQEGEKALKEALSLYKQAETAEGGKYREAALFGMADIYMTLGDDAASESCLAQLAEGGGIDPMLLYPRLLIEQEKWEQAELVCKGQLLQYLNSATAMIAQMAHIAGKCGDRRNMLLYLEKQHALEENFGFGLYMSRLSLAGFYLNGGELQKAAAWLLKYVEGVLQYPLSYENHPIFNGIQLQADKAAQRSLRRTMLRELLKNDQYKPLRGQPEYRRAETLILSMEAEEKAF